MFIAHRAEDGREQPLIDHLNGTAQRARLFAEPFGAGEPAYMMGLSHDIGKYSDEFQKRVRGCNLSTDHSTAGAQEIYRACGSPAAYFE